MKYLIDSAWVVDWLAGRTIAIGLLTTLSTEGFAISLITFGEIFEGIYYGTDPEQAEAGFRNFLRDVPVLPLNQSIMQRFARIHGDLRRRGLLIPGPDILIAATAIEHDLTLVTRNVRHFDRVPGLKLYQAS